MTHRLPSLPSRSALLPSKAKGALATAALLAASMWSGDANACWEEAAARYGIDVRLLYAIAKTESGINPQAINRNTNGSYDVGLMQINSTWFPTLRRFGIQENHLYDPCVSLQVGAWILAQNARRMGNSWQAIGAYNSPNPERRMAYARKVYSNLPKLPVMRSRDAGASGAATALAAR